jgi:hypothetical protein
MGTCHKENMVAPPRWDYVVGSRGHVGCICRQLAWYRAFMDGPALGVGGRAVGFCNLFFGFSKLASNNVQRIIKIPGERVCVFAFQKWTSYPLVLLMVAMRIYLRHYSPIPKPYLAVPYIGLGASLFASSFQYYIQVFRTARK